MSLLQMERIENDKNDPNASIWMQSTDERVKAGLCIENTLLIKRERAPVSTAWILYFKCLKTFSKVGFEEGDMVLVSTVHGGWGKALGKVETFTYSNNQVDQSGLTTDDNHCILIVTSVPSFTLLLILILPPFFSIISLAIDNPKPVPPSCLERALSTL